MSNNRENITWDDEDDDDMDFSPSSFESDTDLVKKLRKALKAEQRRAKELESNLGELSKSQRERILKDVFSSKGVNPKVAAFVPSDLEASEDAITGWLESNAEIFGIEISDKPSPSQQDISAMQKMNNVLTNADTPIASNDMENRIANATTEEEIISILSGNL
jgi:hypothetical protein